VRNRLLLALPALPLLLAAGFWPPPAGLTNYDSARWIDSGLNHEIHGDLAAAERDLLEAARVDRLFQPRWTLAGFYFRRNDPGKFWNWTREALAVGRRDLGALFDLCWKMPDASERIWVAVMPDSKPVWNQYLYYLTDTGKWPAAAGTARRLANVADPSDKAMLVNYCDLALAHGDRAGASAAWNSLRQRGILPFPAGAILTNGDFSVFPSGRCFDWRSPAVNLASPFHKGEAGFTLGGFQHDREVLLEQPLALDPSLNYLLEFEYKTAGLSANSGIRWQAGSKNSDGFAASVWSRGEFPFSGASASLALIYERPNGSTTAVGTVTIRSVSVVAK